ncbi:MAG: hypothetical protein JST30_17030 [Armatimonadetes bacterium]|nr:hypothetical protein [Armatimonadota bacterium]
MKRLASLLLVLAVAAFAAAFIVFPNTITVTRGKLVSGNVNSLVSSDDDRLVVQMGPKLSFYDAPLDLQFDALCSTDTPSVLLLDLETKANAAGLVQYVEMFEWQSGQWVTLDVRPVSTTDQTTQLNIPTCWRFAKPGTGQMRLRYWVSNIGPVTIPNWKVSIDKLNWDVDPQ